jgi:hypothetical protein
MSDTMHGDGRPDWYGYPRGKEPPASSAGNQGCAPVGSNPYEGVPELRDEPEVPITWHDLSMPRQPKENNT